MSALRVPGASLHVAGVGPADAAPLLALHGGPGEAHDYLRPHLDQLASERRRVTYYDQRGGGRSPLDAGVEPAGWQEHVADVDAVRAHLGVDRLDLLGFSWGALLALLYALDHPARVARLVLVAPVPPHAGASVDVQRNLARAAARPEVEALRARLAAAGDTAATRFALRIAPCFADPALALALTPVDTREDVADAVSRSLGRFDVRPRLPALRGLPAQIVYGVHDPIATAHVRETATLLGAAVAALEHAGHAPFVEAPEAFLAAVTGFLDGAGPLDR